MNIEQFRGSLLGLAVGDALGTTLEFKPPGSFDFHSEITGGGPFGLAPGQWTDDTAMALCLAASLVECRGFDAADQMERYLRWYREGYMSATGHCFDIGNTVRAALLRFADTGNPWAGSTAPDTAGNGSLMRLAPVVLAYAGDPVRAVELAACSSRTTHGAQEAVDSCRYMAALIVGALAGATKEELLRPFFDPVGRLWEGRPLAPKVAAIATGAYKQKQPPEIRGSGYVVHCLEATLWAFYNSNSFEDGACLAVNLGEDADTTGAVYGQLAGAFYGCAGIPQRWRKCLHEAELIDYFARELFSIV